MGGVAENGGRVVDTDPATTRKATEGVRGRGRSNVVDE